MSRLKGINDLANLMLFLGSTKVDYSIYTDPECIDEQSVKDGAVLAICIRDSVNMNFDVYGNLVGSSTDSAKSYRRKK
jgi:hypothetical protein